MSYKSILTVVTDPGLAHLPAVVDIARAEDAHLDVLSLGIDRTQTEYYYAGATAMVFPETLQIAQNEARATQTEVEKRLGVEDIRWSADSTVAQIGALGSVVGFRARFADLVVQSKPYGASGAADSEAIVEAAMFQGHAPVLILPEGEPRPFGKRIILAWNQSDEALAATKAALPLLKRAAMVDIVVIDPPKHGPERSDPGGHMSQFLTRHGVKTEISVLARTMPRISEVLNRHARDVDADLIVMGAYGHSRFREAILGGATRSMLEMAAVPVLMAH
jgi:nucleotide-binding universal stress UspA family protein